MAYLVSSDWDRFLSHFPDAHLLQTSPWGELKAAFGWDVVRLVEGKSGAQLLFKPLPLGLSLAYIPKGPLGHFPFTELGPQIDAACRQKKAIFLKVEPDRWEDPDGEHAAGASVWPGFRVSRQNIQPARTLLVDLRGDEEQVLARMKQKTRYNIRLAQKKGVVVHPSADLDTFYRLMKVTGQRDAFGVHTLEYYRRAYELFYPRGECELLLAECEGQPLGALMVFAHGQRAWYFYGASANERREYMPTYLLQWEAIRWARAQGCQEYDLWGVPDVDEKTLEANLISEEGSVQRRGSLWGVYRFKRGFGGQLHRAQGPWDRVYQPLLYAFYCWWVSRRKLDG